MCLSKNLTTTFVFQFCYTLVEMDQNIIPYNGATEQKLAIIIWCSNVNETLNLPNNQTTHTLKQMVLYVYYIKYIYWECQFPFIRLPTPIDYLIQIHTKIYSNLILYQQPNYFEEFHHIILSGWNVIRFGIPPLYTYRHIIFNLYNIRPPRLK